MYVAQVAKDGARVAAIEASSVGILQALALSGVISFHDAAFVLF